MRKYQVVYCFTKLDGSIETDSDGLEQYYMQEIEAYNGGEVIKRLKEKEKFIQDPEIISIRSMEEQN